MSGLWIFSQKPKASDGRRSDIGRETDTAGIATAAIAVFLCLLLMLAVIMAAAWFYEPPEAEAFALVRVTNGTRTTAHGANATTKTSFKAPRRSSRSTTVSNKTTAAPEEDDSNVHV
ncbi:hypothetical protein V5799_026916 [Amblyomma americanum]|uniref:Uncharacterized protein n=1 Tax=Amblyomma americanum TaxID=6943 RepID=A0AAQ4DH73_AMBAM